MVTVEEVFKFRPESVHSVKDAYGFRPALAWKHLGRFNTVQPNVNFRRTYNLPGTVLEERWTGGLDTEALRYRIEAFPEILEKMAINGALKKLKDQGVNLGVAFGERKQTADLAATTFRRFARATRLFRGKFPKEWRKISSTPKGQLLPNSWLEYTYGWRPSIKDVNDSVEQLAQRDAERNYDITVAATRRMTTTRKDPTDSEIRLGLAGTRWELLLHFTTYHRSTVVANYSMENPFRRTLAQLGVTNLADVGWELLPYSFIVDWAVPIGQYFNLQDADAGFQLRRASASNRSTCLGACYGIVAVSDFLAAYETFSISGLESVRYRMAEFERRPFLDGVVPQLYFIKSSLVDDATHDSHVKAAVSLLTQSFASRR